MTYEVFAKMSDQVSYNMELKEAVHIDQQLVEDRQAAIDKAKQGGRG